MVSWLTVWNWNCVWKACRTLHVQSTGPIFSLILNEEVCYNYYKPDLGPLEKNKQSTEREENPLLLFLKVKLLTLLEPCKKLFTLCDRVLVEYFVSKTVFSTPSYILKVHCTPVLLGDFQECVELLILCGLLIPWKLIAM